MSLFFALAAAVLDAAVGAPPVFVSEKAVTFRSPHGVFICPLPKDWVGSDHGTTLFIERPKSCSPQGYPSSGRNFRGGAATRRIEVYYGYWMGEDEPHYVCHRRGNLMFMGKNRPLCRSMNHGVVTLWSQGRYEADTEAEISVSIVTRQSTMANDLKLFRSWAATVRPCRVHWSDSDGKRGAYGPPPDCPKGGEFF